MADGYFNEFPIPFVGATAEGVAYDNTESGLTASDVQGAIDEVGKYQYTSWSENGISFQIARQGKMAQVSAVSGSLSSSFASNATFATIPEGYRPRYMTVETVSTSTGNRILISTTGSILGAATLSSGTALRFTATYICQ